MGFDCITRTSRTLPTILFNTDFAFYLMLLDCDLAGPRSAIGRAPDSKVRGLGFDTRSGNILSFLLPLF